MESLNHFYNIVEDAIARIGLDPAQARGPQPGTWTLTKGSAQVFAGVWYSEQDKQPYFQVLAPLMDWPESNQEALAKDLLMLNYQIFGAAFTLFDQKIVLKVIREVEGMDAQEAKNMIMRVGHYADLFDDQLQKKYPHRVPVGFKSFSPEESQDGEDKNS